MKRMDLVTENLLPTTRNRRNKITIKCRNKQHNLRLCSQYQHYNKMHVVSITTVVTPIFECVIKSVKNNYQRSTRQ